ncbi:hypothetical protein [Arthrobacter sp. H14]|uniref:hypothetical protein n=1 Tax=Arthrobacter sp. H14 TaxID=1312959 RepID=UPI00138AFFFB|nr:hypothetical protein [Arthrobacter sp. H14]
MSYILQIVEANPGVGLAIEAESPRGESKEIRSIRSGKLPASSPWWAESWIEKIRAVLGAPLAGLAGLGTVASLELRTALVILTPLGPVDEFALLPRSDPYLAAAMSPHDVKLTDPRFVVDRANEYLRRMQGPTGAPAWEDISPLTVNDVTPPVLDPAMARRLANLPMGSRAHLADLARRAFLRGPAAASNFAAFYETRCRGYDPATGLKILRQEGLVKVVTDSGIVRNVVAMGRLKPDLQEMLDGAGIKYPKSAPKRRLVELLEIHASHRIDSLVEEQGDGVHEPTDAGRAIADWLLARATVTSRVWAAWMAAYLAPALEMRRD